MQKITKISLAIFALLICTGVGIAASGNLPILKTSVTKNTPAPLPLSDEDISGILAETRALMRRPGVTPDEIASINARLTRSTQIFYRQNLGAIISNLAKKPDITGSGARAFEVLSRTDLRADMSYSYAQKLRAQVLAQDPIDPGSDVFQALIAIERGRGTSTGGLDQATMRQIVLAEKWLLKYGSGAEALPQIIPESELIGIFDELGYMPWSTGDMRAMRRSIVSEGLSMQSRYTRAYLSARMIFTPGAYQPRTYLRNTLKHEKQFASLSCEANSMSHFYNFYAEGANALANKARTPGFVPYPTLSERAAFELFPKNESLPTYQSQDGRQTRVWGDPDKEFVGKVEGKQSISPGSLTGYGIHAKWVVGPLSKKLEPLGYSATVTEFSELRVLWNILRSEPVLFWFVLSDTPKEWFAKIEWQTTSGEKRTGYIGEHTGIIIGAEIDGRGRASKVAYYEGRSDALTWAPWGDTARKASYFDAMITARKTVN